MLQCSKTVASTATSTAASASRLIHALELPWSLVNTASSTTRQDVHIQPIAHSSIAPCPIWSDKPEANHASTSTSLTTKLMNTKKEHQHHQRYSRQAVHRPYRTARYANSRSFSSTSRQSREEAKTQAKFIDTSHNSGNSNDAGAPPKPATKSTSTEHNSDNTSTSSEASSSNSSLHHTPSDTTPKSSSSSSSKEPHQEKHLQYLNEEVISSSSSTDKGTSSKDQINTLLSYPTLYDPIRKPRFPIVLCHGLYGFDTWGLELLPALKVHYWADVLHVLKGVVGVDPVVVGVPGTGAITERAKQLHNVLRNDKKLAGKQVNLIGHSMGGLDCRHLLTNIRPSEYHPVSLTTLATPHRGSPFMAWCRANIGIGDIARAAEEASKEKLSSSSSEVNLPYSLKTPIFSRSKWQQSQKDQSRDKDKNRSKSDMEALEQTKAAARQAVDDASSALSGSTSTKAAITKTVINLPGLNFTLGTSLASYLLDLLDSPAYSNLTSDYLETIFNPNTPDRDDIKYFSIAARINKLPITHPLWLPKLIVDKAQEWEKAKDLESNKNRRNDWQWGNDGLVPVESAKWGEFLGVLDGADHWSIRGGAGFTTEPKAKKGTATQATTPAAEKKAVVDNVSHTQEKQPEKGGTTDSTRHPDTQQQEEASELDKLGEKAKAAVSTIVDMAAPVTEATSSVLPSFNWSDINTAVFKGLDGGDGNGNGKPAASDASKSATKDVEKGKSASSTPSTTNGNIDTLKTLSSIAGWVAKRIPLPSSNKNQLKSSIDPAYPLDDTTAIPKATASSSTPTSASEKTSVTNAARLLFGSSSSSKTSKNSNGDSNKFNRERFYVALCKKLYDEGF